jgi:hypothetical protein
MTNGNRPPVGTALFPQLDTRPGGPGGPAAPPARLSALPRRRRPMMIALAVAMACAGVVVSAAVYQRSNHQASVVTVTRPVAAGSVVTAGDLGTTRITTGSGVSVIPASQLGQVAGQIAAVALRPATLLAPADLTTSRPPGAGQQLVAVPVRPASLPVTGLAPGDHVLVVATPGAQGQAGAQGATAALPAPVAAVVEAAATTPDSQGYTVVDLLVASNRAVSVADQVSTGQFALIVTRRS